MGNLNTALTYLKKGISVIPVGKDKHPLIATWVEFQKRRATEEEVKKWWQENPEANIGIVTGEISNLLVVDIDNKNGVVGSTAGLPPTLVAKTGGGGWHYYYRYTSAIGNKIRIRENVDIKGEGGYVIAPPSVHASGKKYEWAVLEEPQPFPIELFKNDLQQVKTHDWEKLLVGTAEGSRNETMASVIGKLLVAFKEAEWATAVWAVVVKLNQLNKPPLEDAELRAVFNSITNRERRKKTEVEETDIVLLSKAVQENSPIERPKFKTGFSFIDDNTKGGIREGDLIIISGKTGEGKTHYAQTITYNLAQNKVPTLWFSFEVAYDELWERFKGMGVDDNFITYVPLKIVSRKISWLEEQIKKARDAFQSKVVFIDHLDYLIPSVSESHNITKNFATYIGMICRELKTIAIRENVVIIMMAHVRRTNDPTIDDLKDSSSVGQEADIVLMLKRIGAGEETRNEKDKYSVPKEDFEEVYSPYTKVSIVKNRRTGITKKDRVFLQNGRFVSVVDYNKQVNEEF